MLTNEADEFPPPRWEFIKEKEVPWPIRGRRDFIQTPTQTPSFLEHEKVLRADVLMGCLYRNYHHMKALPLLAAH